MEFNSAARLAVMVLAMAGAPLPAAAQQADSSSVPVFVGVALPPATVSVDTVRGIDFGTVFRPHPDRGDCVYRVQTNGVSVSEPQTRDGRSAAIAGCGFRDGQAPLPGRIAFTCVPGASIGMRTQVSQVNSSETFLFQIPAAVVRDSNQASLGQLGQTGTIACPQTGAGFVDFGFTLFVASTASVAPRSERIRLTVTATVL